MLFLATGCGGGTSFFTPPPAPTLQQQFAGVLKEPLKKNAGREVGFAIAFVQAKSGPGVTKTAPPFGTYFFGNLVANADPSSPLPLDTNTSFEIGSVTKTFTATLLALLATDPATVFASTTNTYLPLAVMNPAIPNYLGTNTTIGQLATYTSGLVDVNLVKADTNCPPQVPSPCFLSSSMIANFASSTATPIAFQPGTSFLYSDLGFALLSFALPRINGSTTTDPDSLQADYEGLLQTDILTPIGMPATHFFDQSTDGPNIPLSYDPTGNPSQVNHDTTWPAYLGAGGIVSTPAEMLTFLQFNLGLLNTGLEPLLPLLQGPATAVTTADGGSIGLAWFIGKLAGSQLTLLNKNGGVSGFATQIDFTPATGAGVVVMTNSRDLLIGNIASKMMQILNGIPSTGVAPDNGDGA